MKIGIIGAMEPEVAILREQISNRETITVAGCEFYSGELAGHQVILTRSGIGKVAASIATTILLGTICARLRDQHRFRWWL